MITLTGVLDANVIIGLAKGNVFDLLSSVYSPLYIPTTVKQEIIAQGQGRAGESELRQSLGVWITEVAPDPTIVQQLPTSLSEADREVLAVALAPATAIDHVLADDRPLLRVASRFGLTCLRTPDVVVLLKARGLVADVRSVLDRMRSRGFGIADDLYERALRTAGEWPTP